MKAINFSSLFAEFLTKKLISLVIDESFRLSHIGGDCLARKGETIQSENLHTGEKTRLTPLDCGSIYSKTIHPEYAELFANFQSKKGMTMVCVAINQEAINNKPFEFYPKEDEIAQIGETVVSKNHRFNDTRYRHGIWQPLSQ